MNMEKLNGQKLPEIFFRNGKPCYLDSIRGKLIPVTPEETVRQKMIAHLINELGVPVEMIAVEEHLSHYHVNTKRRADIIIHKYNQESEELQPLVVIECKAPGLLLGNRAAEQMMDYADLIGSDYGVLVNGDECLVYFYQHEEQTYRRIDTLPTYENMLGKVFDIWPDEPVSERIPFEEIPQNLDTYIENEIIGEQSSKELQAIAVNLFECYMDETNQFPSGRYRIFRLVKDVGVTLQEYGNASGGIFSGLYRSFLVEYKNSTEMVSIGIAPYVTWAHQDIQKTVINVGIDNEKKTHHSVQLVLDDNLLIIGKRCIFRHHGRIAVGHMGSGKVSELKVLIAEKYPDILKGDKIELGELCHDSLWQINQPEVMALTENLISYALIRDEYREQIMDRKK